jgi:hypothetical protein
MVTHRAAPAMVREALDAARGAGVLAAEPLALRIEAV